jgi:hypothetical protein
MEYYWIKKDYDYQDLAWLNGLPSTRDGKPDLRWYTPEGVVLENDKPLIVYVPRGSKSKKKPAIYFFGNNFIMVPPEMKEDLESRTNADICQFIEFELLNERTNNTTKLYLVNPFIFYGRNMHKGSEHKRQGIYNFLIKLALEDKAIPLAPIFLVRDDTGMQPRIFVINQDIYELIKHAKGVEFLGVVAA